jgi:hypothetical protein
MDEKQWFFGRKKKRVDIEDLSDKLPGRATESPSASLKIQ